MLWHTSVPRWPRKVSRPVKADCAWAFWAAAAPVSRTIIRFETQPRERDRVFTYDGDVRVFIDPKSFIYLNGMVLDYEETLMRQGFNFINPNSKKSCGCGSSFTT